MSRPLSFRVGSTVTEVAFGPAPAFPDAALTVFDDTTARLFGAAAAARAVIPAGEAAKTWDGLGAILSACAERGLSRDSVLAGVGGGVVCDMTALSASLYMRGCGLALAPTTLLAMVDASLGGKAAVDFLGYKNLVGSFYPAQRILICPAALASLPEREYRSGLAEVIKCGIIGDAELFALLDGRQAAVEARDPGLLEEMIRRCLLVKGALVEEDPREAGRRALLNLGHTFGHALESATGLTTWTHGEAVAWGIGRALAAGERLGMTDPGFARRVRGLLARYGYRLEAGVRYTDLEPALARDKKRRDGRLRLVIPCGMGDVRVREASAEDIAAAFDDVRPASEERGRHED
jgi:3-dehydroquinate synthase